MAIFKNRPEDLKEFGFGTKVYESNQRLITKNGGKASVETLKGMTKINIAAGTENGKVLRLKNMGMPFYNEPDKFGDLYAKVNITLPKDLSPKEIELFRQLEEIRNKNKN